jgi:hypothetical protein
MGVRLKEPRLKTSIRIRMPLFRQWQTSYRDALLPGPEYNQWGGKNREAVCGVVFSKSNDDPDATTICAGSQHCHPPYQAVARVAEDGRVEVISEHDLNRVDRMGRKSSDSERRFGAGGHTEHGM